MSRSTTAKAARQTTLILQFGLLILALFYSLGLHAEEAAGRLLFVRGDVQITSVNADPRAAQRGDVLHVGDTISTGTASSAQLRMSDGAMISLRADTIYRIEGQDYNRKAPAESSQVGELLRGGLRAITGAIGHEKPEAVKYRTPVATIGIRGTVFDTIYIPPEGLTELPGMAPGTYVMVLEGQVLLSTATGELLLGPGEVGYVPFADAPPELRPDLASIFVEFASFDEQDRPKTASGQESYSRTVAGVQNNGRIYSLLGDVAATQILRDNPTGTTSATVSPGPYGIAVAGNGVPPAQGNFFSSPVTVGMNGELTGASNGGGISNFTLTATTPIISQQGSYTAGDSVINWGIYAPGDVTAADGTGGQLATAFNYLTATNVIVTTADLPTVGSYSYNYVGGTSTYADSPTQNPVITSGNLTVDFGTAQMDVSLNTSYGGYSASNQNISDFYGNGVALSGPFGAGSSIGGRFVGSSAEGAIAGYSLFVGDGYATGVAVFAR